MALCRSLIQAAKDCQVNAVKFQSWSKSSLISRSEYDRNTHYGTGDGATLSLEQAVGKYQMTPSQHREIASFCRDQGVTFFSSCFSFAEVDLLESLEVPAYKIASMDVNNLPLLAYVAETEKPVILSTGLATLGEIEVALEVLQSRERETVALLHCLSIYPSPPEIVDLRNIKMLRKAFDVPVGYSDHTLGAAIPLASIALGACIIEKHFTLDTRMEGWDHAISADPDEMRHLVRESQNVHAALGRRVRSLSDEQMSKRVVFRRSMVAKKAIVKGERLSARDVEFKRPGTGIRPDELRYAINRVLVRDVEAEKEIEWEDLT
jgi:N-acetylneuraminate synthase